MDQDASVEIGTPTLIGRDTPVGRLGALGSTLGQICGSLNDPPAAAVHINRRILGALYPRDEKIARTFLCGESPDPEKEE